MAQAQVVISAVDKTQAAINSALRSMKTLERTAKVTAKAVNLAFGFLTGTAIIAAFGKITDAAKKTEEGRRAIDDLNKALKDPALVSAANAFTVTLISGFTKVVEIAASLVKNIRAAGEALGVIDVIDRSQLSGRGPSSRGRRPNIDELTRMENQWKQSIETDKLNAKFAAEAKKRTDAARMAMAERQAEENQRYQDLKKQALEISDLYEVEFDNSLTNMSSSISEMLDEFAAQQEMFKMFAENAAKNIQSAFADFLFDPFENGIRGMLASFMDVIRRMIAEVAASFILQAIFGGFTKDAGFMGDFARAITGRASGGSVSANTPYIVGERGPELFVPNSSGSIVPNGRMGGVTVAPVYNIDARGATADLQKALPSILSENNRRIFDELDRRYGIGR